MNLPAARVLPAILALVSLWAAPSLAQMPPPEPPASAPSTDSAANAPSTQSGAGLSQVARMGAPVHSGPLKAVAFSADGRMIAVGGEDRTLSLWDVTAGQLAVELKAPSAIVGLAFLADGSAVVAALQDGAVQLWHPQTKEARATLRQPQESTSVSAGGTSSALLATDLSGAARVFDLQGGGEPKLLQADAPALASALSADGKTALTGHAFSKLRKGRQLPVVLWDVASGKVVRRAFGPASDVLAVALDPKGRWFAAGDAGGSIHLYRLEDTDSYTRLSVGSAVRGLSFREDGAALASVSDDGALRVWDVATQAERARLDVHPAGARAVAFSPSGSKLATAGLDGTAKIFDASALAGPAAMTGLQAGLAKARELAKGSDKPAAKQAALDVVSRFPDSADAHVLYGSALFGEDRAAGEAELRKAVQLKPDHLEANYYLAVLGRAGPVEARRRYLAAAAAANPTAMVVLVEQAEVEKADGKLNKAARFLYDALAVLPESAAVLYNVACVEALRGLKTQALALLEHAVDAGYSNAGHTSEDADLVSLRSEPKFRDLLSRMSAGGSSVQATGEAGAADKFHAAAMKEFSAENYAEALVLFRKAIAEERVQKKPRTGELGANLHWTGMCFKRLERHQEAVRAFEESLSLDVDQLVPITLIMKAEEHARLRQYSLAVKSFERAIPLQLAQKQPELASKSLMGLGDVLVDAGRYDEAMARFREALAMPGNKPPRIALLQRGVGHVYAAWGQRDQALQQYRLAIEEARKGDEPSVLMSSYSELGNALAQAKDFPGAIAGYEQALQMARRLNLPIEAGLALSSLANVSSNKGDKAAALRYSDEAIAEARKLGRPRSVAMSLLAKGVILRKLKDTPGSIAAIQEALPIARADGDPLLTASVLDALGQAYIAKGDVDTALTKLKEVADLHRGRGALPNLQATLTGIGQMLFSASRYPQAVPYLSEAVQITERLRKTAQGDARRDYFARESELYEMLSLSQMGSNDAFAAYRTIELSRAKVLAERLSSREDEVAVPTIADIQRLSGDGAILLYSHSTWPQLGQFRFSRSGMQAFAHGHAKWTQGILSGNAVMVAENAHAQRGVKAKLSSARSITPSADGIEQVVHLYRALLQDPRPESVSKARAIGRVLYDELIAPHAKYLPAGEDLLIVPDGVLAFLPFETLVDPQGRYLAETFRVRYVQSLAVLDQIGRRAMKKDRKPLLALGGAPYAAEAVTTAAVKSSGQLAVLQDRAGEQMAQAGSLREAYAALGVQGWQDLPGTLAEVQGLQRLVPGADVLTGADVRESKVKAMSASGELARYRVVHFATHGLVVPQLPELSALVLSQRPDGAEDGYLRMGEIGQLKLGADYVNLSACETGLGKIYGGEGVVGLTQAFLIAGANGVSVSLWQVADASTAVFMQALYKTAAEKKISYAAAAADVKRRFIKGELGAAWTAPYFWAPFVHYGQ